MDIRKSEPTPTLSCKYSLALQDDSVFTEYDMDDAGCIYLARISFDGFGCRKPEDGIGKIDAMNYKYIVT